MNKNPIIGRSFTKYASYDSKTDTLGHVFDGPHQVKMCFFEGMGKTTHLVEVKVTITKISKA